MDLLGHYRQLANYDAWANQEVIASFRAGAPSARALNWLAHIVAAEHVWLARIRGVASPFAVWPQLSLDECAQQAEVLAQSWRDLLKDSSSLDQLVSYKNSKGEAYESLVRDILTHVFLHSTYHRGQIAADARQSGGTPAYTDFIHGVRQGWVA
jgi:uncharacterized damage-inducible protein DinB